MGSATSEGRKKRKKASLITTKVTGVILRTLEGLLVRWCFRIRSCASSEAPREEVSTDQSDHTNRPKRGPRISRAYHGTTRRLGHRYTYLADVIGNWILACSFTTSYQAQKQTTSCNISNTVRALLHKSHGAAVFLLSALVASHLALPGKL